MKKRIIGFALVLCLLLCGFSMTAMAADSTKMNVEFNEIAIGIDYVTKARVNDAVVIDAVRLPAQLQDDEKNRVHIQVELSNNTANGDIVHVEMGVTEQSASGIGSALKAVKGTMGIDTEDDDLYYEVAIENGKGQMTCYSYYNHTEYTTFVIDFVVGEEPGVFDDPVVCPVNDAVLRYMNIWNQPVLKSYFKNIGDVPQIDPNAHGDHKGLVGYIWLEESVPDDAVIGMELIRNNSRLLNYPGDWSTRGGYVKLKDGEAVVEFSLQGLNPGPVGQNRKVTIYIKNHLSYAPEFADGIEGVVELQTEVGVPYIVDFAKYFTDKDTKELTYRVAVNDAEPTTQSSSKYRYIPSAEGTRTLQVQAYDGFYLSEIITIVLNATEDHVWGEWTVEKAATCTENGSRTHICTCCYTKETETITAPGVHNWDEWIVKKNANCVEDGVQIHTCADCGAMDTGTIPAGDHDWVITSSTATCGEAGQQTAICPGCNESKVTEVPATGNHKWSDWTQTKAPGCVDVGTESRTCGVCGSSEDRDIPATGVHVFGSWQQTKAPSCVDGERVRGCTTCDLTETASIAATGMHRWGDWEVITEATPDADGLERRSCLDCDATEENALYYKEPFAYVNISISGKIVLSLEEIPLVDCIGGEGITLDDVLYKTHELHSPGGANDYASYNGFVQKLWGIGNAPIGYLIDHKFSWDVNETVKRGDVVDAYIYSDMEGYSDLASYFSKDLVKVDMEQTVDLTLYRIVYGSTIETNKSIPVENAKIFIDGKATDYRTDANGNVTISFNEGGRYLVSAASDTYPLVPPVCVVEVDSKQTKLPAPVLTDAAATTTSLIVTPPAPSALDPEAVAEYSISADGKTWSKWQQNNTFDKLTVNTAYQIRARYITSNPARFLDSDASEILQVSTAEGESAVYVLGDAQGCAGETVSIPVKLVCDARDISRWNAALAFDSSVLTLVGMEKGADSADWNIKLNRVTRCVYGNAANGAANGINGEIFVLTFKIKESAPLGEYTIGLGETWNTAAQNAFWNSKGAYVYVKGQATASTLTVTEAPERDETVTTKTPAFADVAEETWYAESVRYMSDTGLMCGTAEDTFSPEVTTSRAMLVTMLYRMEGEPEVSTKAPFEDVAENTWYSNAVAWAAENEIVYGVSKTMFAPHEDVTREQTAAILYRYNAYLGLPSTANADLSGFEDAQNISAYAADAMKWAVGEGLILGTDEHLEPNGNATRAQVATVLSRYLGE